MIADGPALSATGVHRSFGTERALDGVDLVVRPGEVCALVGLNGAGKSTLMRILLGMLRPDAGTVSVLGRPVAAAGPPVWRQVGHLIETPSRYAELTVAESVYAAARLHGLTRAAARRRAADLIDELGLGHWSKRLTGGLSLGNRQRLGIATALVHDPKVLVLDEPSNALDPRGVVRVRELLQARARGAGAAVLVSSHHLDEVARMADRTVVLHQGLVIGSLDPRAADVERQFFAMALAAECEDDERREAARRSCLDERASEHAFRSRAREEDSSLQRAVGANRQGRDQPVPLGGAR